MSLRILWHNLDGTLTITKIVGIDTTADYATAAQAKIAKGHRTPEELAGVFDSTVFPDMRYWPAARVSAGALVVKLDLARNLRWQALRAAANERLQAANAAFIDALADGDAARQTRITTVRNNLKQLIAAQPPEVVNAVNLSAIDAAVPAALNAPIP